jgi:PAS domain S-box-containing protein
MLKLHLDNSIADCNEAFSILTGLSKTQATGTNLSQLGILDQNALGEIERLLSLANQGAVLPSEELTLVGNRGDRVHVEAFAIRLFPNGEDGSAFLGFHCVDDRTDSDRTDQLRMELRNEREFIRSLLDTSNSLIICLDKRARIVVFNKECERVTGYTRKEVLGKNWLETFLPEDQRHDGLENFADWVRKYPEGAYSGPIKTKAGEIRTILWSNSALFSPSSDDLTAIAIGYDITDRKWSEELQSMLYQITNAVSTADDQKALFQSIQKHLGAVIDTKNFYIALYDRDTDTILSPYVADEKVSISSFPAGKTMTAYVIKNDVPLLATKEVKNRLTEAGEIEAIGAPSEVWLGVPLKVGDEVIGAVVVQDYSNPNAYGPRELEILKFASGQIALAIERKRAEEALRTSEHRYALATQAASVGVWDWNIETNEFYIDPEVKANLGYEDHEIPNDIEVWTGYVHPDDLQPVMEAAQAHIDGLTSEYVFEHRMLHKDGSVRWILVRGKAVRDAQGKAVRMVGTDTDITERKLAEEAAERAHFELNQVFEAATPMNVIDKDFNMLRVNDTFSILFGVTKDDVVGKKCFDVYPGPLCHTDYCPLKRVLHGEQVHEYEDRTKLPNGRMITSIVTAFPYRGPDGNFLGIVESFTDITDRKKAEEALRLSEERFRELADLLPQTVFEIDQDAYLTFSNRQGFEMTGYGPQDIEKGLRVFQMFGSEEQRKIAERIPKLLAGEVFGGNEYTLIRKDGRSVPVIAYSSPIVRDNKTVGLRGIVMDITARKKAEIELKAAYEELQKEQSRLTEMNIALREVLRQIEGERRETKLQIQTNVNRLVLPILSRLKASCGPENVMHLEFLQESLEKVTSPFLRALETKIPKLTPREIQICNMIKEGRGSKEIATALDISDLTVNKFRQQIRKKLRIVNKKVNLASYLKSL